MKRLISAAVILAALAVGASADQGQHVYEVIGHSITHLTITVSTSTATQVDSTQLSNRLVLEIQNIDTTANLWCSTSNAVALNAGHKIVPSAWWTLAVSNGFVSAGGTSSTAKFYCISDGAASTKAFVTQAY